MSTVTLVPPALAEPGTEFVYRGEAPGCAGCPYRAQCLNLEPGRRYRVAGRREGGQALDCAVHDGGEVVAVEVEPAPVRAAVPSRGTFAGSAASPAGGCPHTECPSHPVCVPAGADPDGEYVVDDVLGDPPHREDGVPCALDRDLDLVELSAQE